MPGEGVEPCPACGTRQLREDRRGSLVCAHCGIEVRSSRERTSGGPAHHREPCPWCANGFTVLASTVGQSARGAWEVYQCDGCGAQYATYVRAGPELSPTP